jgi:periplasmic divalent cation tolerance protein
MSEFISVYITAPSGELGEIIGRTLVEERLVACINIIAGMRSIYRWEGKVEAANEVVLIAKSRATLFEEIEKRVKELHPYDCPCIVAWPIAAGHQPYLNWLAQEAASRNGRNFLPSRFCPGLWSGEDSRLRYGYRDEARRITDESRGLSVGGGWLPAAWVCCSSEPRSLPAHARARSRRSSSIRERIAAKSAAARGRAISPPRRSFERSIYSIIYNGSVPD